MGSVSSRLRCGNAEWEEGRLKQSLQDPFWVQPPGAPASGEQLTPTVGDGAWGSPSQQGWVMTPRRDRERPLELGPCPGLSLSPAPLFPLQFDLPFVSVHRVRALRFTPKQLEGSEERERPGCSGWKGLLRGLCWGEQPLSSWSCDGETLPHADISVR